MTEFLWILVILAAPVLGAISLLRRPGRLDCGCLNDGAVYGCTVCDYTRCAEHRYDVHDCNERLATGG